MEGVIILILSDLTNTYFGHCIFFDTVSLQKQKKTITRILLLKLKKNDFIESVTIAMKSSNRQSVLKIC